MEKQIFKILGKEIVEINALNRPKKTAVLRCVRDGQTAFIIVKMYSFTKPNLNEVEDIPEKAWKHFFPIPIKASFDGEYIFSLFDLLCL